MDTSNHACPTCERHPAAPQMATLAHDECADPCHDMAVAVYDAWAAFKGIKAQCEYIPDSPPSDPDPFVVDVKGVFGV